MTNPLNRLTRRQRQVLAGLAIGQTNRQIAVDLNLSEKTVQNYTSCIYRELGVANRVQAALWWMKENGNELSAL